MRTRKIDNNACRNVKYGVEGCVQKPTRLMRVQLSLRLEARLTLLQLFVTVPVEKYNFCDRTS